MSSISLGVLSEAMPLNMLEPELPGHKARRTAYKSSGDYISDKMPISDHEGGCPGAKEDGQDGQRTRLKPNHNDRERSRHHHMAGGKAAVLIALEEIEYLARDSLEEYGWILTSENEL
jgi:hypothetical protein